MSELRQSIATREWVIIATDRARRPHDYRQEGRPQTHSRPIWDADCPFCPGNEEAAATERLRLPATGPWGTRVVLNKYPALQLDGERVRQFDGIHRVLSGVGHHEVIIESPQHNTCLALLNPVEVSRTLEAFQMRGLAYAADPRVEQVIYFENHGPEAGTSIEHPHAQMVGLPVVPHNTRARMEEARRYFDDTGHCVFCDMWQAEAREGVRMIAANEHFVAFIPYAAFSPFHTWIVPRRHAASYTRATPAELLALGRLLQDVLHRVYVGLGDPDYNYIIRSAPPGASEGESLHWYVSIIPHVCESAGFEMGSGMFINSALPEESAAFLRAIDPS